MSERIVVVVVVVVRFVGFRGTKREREREDLSSYLHTRDLCIGEEKRISHFMILTTGIPRERKGEGRKDAKKGREKERENEWSYSLHTILSDDSNGGREIRSYRTQCSVSRVLYRDKFTSRIKVRRSRTMSIGEHYV